MIKKATALLFFFISSIILLVNAVIPHHHHNTALCMASSHCETEQPLNDQHDCKDDHQHDGSSNSDYCILKPLLVIPPDQSRQWTQSNLNDLSPSLFLNYMATPGPQDLPNAIASKYLLPTSRICLTYADYIGCCTGLRAPPIV